MKFFELTNGWLGESYVRSYAWAESKEHAVELYLKRVKGTKYEGDGRIEGRELFDSSDSPFCTIPNDRGFEEE